MMVWNDNQPMQPLKCETLASEGQQSSVAARKPFIEPVISSPVDVLKATTFFQVVDSGGTLRRPQRT
jgi:hypothetical protein